MLNIWVGVGVGAHDPRLSNLETCIVDSSLPQTRNALWAGCLTVTVYNNTNIKLKERYQKQKEKAKKSTTSLQLSYFPCIRKIQRLKAIGRSRKKETDAWFLVIYKLTPSYINWLVHVELLKIHRCFYF